MSNENGGLCQYELDRLARIAENKKRMQVWFTFPNFMACALYSSGFATGINIFIRMKSGATSMPLITRL